MRASVGIAVSAGCGAVSGAVVTIAALVTARADENMGGAAEVVAVLVVGATAAENDPEPDMADTRLLECGLLRRE